MRDIINQLNIYRPYNGIKFYGTSGSIDIDPVSGALFSDFNQAVDAGPDVYECRISLRNAYYAVSRDEFIETMVSFTHDRSFDGCVIGDGSEIIVFDQNAVEIIGQIDANCSAPRPEIIETHTILEYRPEPDQHIIMVTGQLAKTGLQRVVDALGEIDFTYEIRALDIAIAAWLTTDKIAEEIGDVTGADAILIPGKTMGDDSVLENAVNIPVIRGPVCYSELPVFLEYIGIDVDPSGIVRPKILLINASNELGNQLASTYEVPHITPDEIVDTLGADDPIVAAYQAQQPALHNVKAELIRSRLVMRDALGGFVMQDYPANTRDCQWLDEMTTLDVIVMIDDGYNNEVSKHYQDHLGYTVIPANDPDMLSSVFTKVETILQQCVRQPLP